MRIYAVADIHSKPEHMDTIFSAVDKHRPDLVVAAGDLTHFFNWRTCLSQLDSLSVPVLAIRGNTDLKRINAPMKQAANLTDLNAGPVQIRDFSFVGAEGALLLPFASKICLKEEARLEKLPAMGPETVMVVHPPPRGILDKVGGRFSAGSRGLTRFIKAAGPGLVLCGHIHDHPGIARLGKSVVVNCSLGKSSQGAVIDIEKGTPPRAIVLHP